MLVYARKLAWGMHQLVIIIFALSERLSRGIPVKKTHFSRKSSATFSLVDPPTYTSQLGMHPLCGLCKFCIQAGSVRRLLTTYRGKKVWDSSGRRQRGGQCGVCTWRTYRMEE